MKLVYPSWNFQIQFTENTISQLIIEAPEYFRECVSKLTQQIVDDEGEFVLSENNVLLNLSKKADLIVNPFTLELNNRKVLNGLYDQISNLVNEGEKYISFCEICSDTIEFFHGIEEELDYGVEYNERLDIKHFLKAFDVRISAVDCNFEERILTYVEIMREFCGIECFLFVNLKDYLTKEKMEVLCNELNYKKIAVLLIESSLKYKMKRETTWIIDKDLCEIY